MATNKTNTIMIISAIILIFTAVFAAAQNSGVTEEQAMSALLQAEEDIQEMADAGFSTTLANDAFTEAKKAFTGENYSKMLADTEKINDTKRREEVKRLLLAAQEVAAGAVTDYNLVVEKADEIREIKERAFEINDLLKALEMRIDDLKDTVDVSDVEEIKRNAEKEFNEESYDKAEEIANEGFNLLDTKAAEATQLKLMYKGGKEAVINFVKENWLGILIGVISAVIIILILHKMILVILLKAKLKDLMLEKDVLNDLIKIAQKERFQKGTITKKEYDIKVIRFKQRLVEVNKETPIVEAKLKGKKII
jgi:uncharacterized membrane protein